MYTDSGLSTTVNDKFLVTHARMKNRGNSSGLRQHSGTLPSRNGAHVDEDTIHGMIIKFTRSIGHILLDVI
jgi:hypothetical protein